MAQTIESFTSELISLLETAYTTTDPTARRTAIEQVEAIQHCEQSGISPKELAAVGIQILQRPDISLPCRAYGAIILRSLLLMYGEFGKSQQLTGTMSVDDTHYADIAAWIVGADDQDNCYAGRMSNPSVIGGGMCAPSIHKVVVSSSSQLIATAASLYWPDHTPNLFQMLCNPDGSLANRRNTQRILLEVCRSCCEPSFASLPKGRIGKLRTALSTASPSIVRAIVGALERQYVYLLGVSSQGLLDSPEYIAVQAVAEDMSCCLETLSLAIRTSENMLQVLWNTNVCEALSALIQLNGAEDIAKVSLMALDACVAIVGNIPQNILTPKEPSPTHSNDIIRFCDFCVNVISTLPRFVNQRDYDSVMRIVEIIARSASLKALLAVAKEYGCNFSLSQAVLQAACLALQVPNVIMATDVCEALADLLASATDSTNENEQIRLNELKGFDPENCLLSLTALAVRDNFNAWVPLVPRHTEQETNYQSQGRTISELFCDSSDAFMAAYSQLRSAMAPLLSLIGVMYPIECQQFVTYLLGKLQPATGADPTTRSGNVTQRSATYSTWESIDFLTNAILPSAVFSCIITHVNRQQTENWLSTALGTLKSKSQLADATLTPPFLNIYQHFLTVCLPSSESMFAGVPKKALSLMYPYGQHLSEQAALFVATEAVEAFFYFMRLAPLDGGSILSDPDLVASRKRAMTLLIRFCSTFASGLCNSFPESGQKVVQQIKFEAERSLVSDLVLPSERSLLNEALAGLTNVMSSNDAEASIRGLLGPSVDVLTQVGNVINGEYLGKLLADDTRNGQRQRDSLRDSVSTITAVLRRSTVNEFTTQVAATVIPLLGGITIAVHGLNTNHLPPQYASILDPTDDEQKMAMINGSGVRLPPDLSNRIGSTKRYLASLRMALYQGVALLPRFLSVSNFIDGVSSILSGAQDFSTPIMRDLCVQCLFLVSAECPPLVGITLRALQSFLQQRGSVQATEAQQIVDVKQMTYFSKDIASYIRGSLVEGVKYQDVVKGPPVEGPSYQSTAMALVASNTASMAFLSNNEGLELFVSSVAALLVWGSDIRSASYLAIIAINEMLKRSTTAEYNEACIILFATAAASIVTNSSVDRANTKEYLLSLLSDLYVHHYPFFSTALTLSEHPMIHHALRGSRPSIATAADVETLHAHLMATKGPRQKRRLFVDFITRCLVLQS